MKRFVRKVKYLLFLVAALSILIPGNEVQAKSQTQAVKEAKKEMNKDVKRINAKGAYKATLTYKKVSGRPCFTITYKDKKIKASKYKYTFNNRYYSLYEPYRKSFDDMCYLEYLTAKVCGVNNPLVKIIVKTKDNKKLFESRNGINVYDRYLDGY